MLQVGSPPSPEISVPLDTNKSRRWVVHVLQWPSARNCPQEHSDSTGVFFSFRMLMFEPSSTCVTWLHAVKWCSFRIHAMIYRLHWVSEFGNAKNSVDCGCINPRRREWWIADDSSTQNSNPKKKTVVIWCCLFLVTGIFVAGKWYVIVED